MCIRDRLYPSIDLNDLPEGDSAKQYIIPPARVRYLSEITETIRAYNSDVETQSDIASKLYGLNQTMGMIDKNGSAHDELTQIKSNLEQDLNRDNREILDNWEDKVKAYREDTFVYKVRDKEIKVENFTKSLSQQSIPKIAMPKFKDWGEILRWVKQENVPGEFPFTAGVFPFKRKGEDPTLSLIHI